MERPLIYGVDEKPTSWWSTVFLGLQQASVCYIGMLPAPLVVASILGLDPFDTGLLICACSIGVGLATLLQIYYGTRLPIMQGPAFSFIVVASAIFAIVEGSPAEKMACYTTALFLGGLFEALIGFGKLVGYVRRVMTPAVTGTVVILIGLALFPWATDTISSHWGFGILMMALVFYLSYFKGAAFMAFSALITIVVGSVICMVGTLAGVFAPGTPLYVDFSPVLEASWFAVPRPFPWGLPKFSAVAFLVILAPVFASIVESLGDYLAVAEASKQPTPTEQQFNRGIGSEGLGCMISTLFGGISVTSYSQSTALLILTKVASRFVFAVAAIIALALGLVPKIGVIFGILPNPIIGGVYFATFGLIVGIGFGLLQAADLTKDRTKTVVGMAVFLGMAVPYYIGASPVQVSFAPWLADIINGLLNTSMAVGGVVAIILDQVLPGKAKASTSTKTNQALEG